MNESFPLMKRAWVYQERLLSPRMLHFGPQELEWECLEKQQCECSFGHSARAAKFLGKPLVSKQSTRWALPNAGDDDLLSRQVLSMWMQTVTEYSSLDLKNEGDIFVALSGIAQLFSKIHDDTEVNAGFLMEGLAMQLTWHTESDIRILDLGQRSGTCRDRLAPRPSTWRAPTWSWASSKCPVEFKHTNGFQPFASFQLLSIPVTKHSFGQLKAAYLFARCKLSPAVLSYEFPKRKPNGHLYSNSHVINSKGSHVALQVNGEFLSLLCYVDYNIWSQTEHRVPNGSSVFCMKLGAATVGATNGTRGVTDCFLILREKILVDGPQLPLATYERIGFAETPPDITESEGIDVMFGNRVEEVVEIVIV